MNDGWEDGQKTSPRMFFWNKLQNGNLENVTSSLQRINNAFEMTIAPI